MKSIVSELLPKDTPIELIIEHGNLLGEVSDVMGKLVETYFNRKDISKLVEFISEKEGRADEIKFQLRKMLDRHVKIPFPKPTLLQALHVQDDIIDMMEDIAKRMSMNYIDFELGKNVQKDFLDLVGSVKKILEYLQDAICELKTVMASSFSKRERKKEEKEIVKIEELESEIDQLTQKLGKWAFSKKDKYNPIDIIFFNDLVLIFAEIGDKAENLAELLRTLTH